MSSAVRVMKNVGGPSVQNIASKSNFALCQYAIVPLIELGKKRNGNGDWDGDEEYWGKSGLGTGNMGVKSRRLGRGQGQQTMPVCTQWT